MSANGANTVRQTVIHTVESPIPLLQTIYKIFSAFFW